MPTSILKVNRNIYGNCFQKGRRKKKKKKYQNNRIKKCIENNHEYEDIKSRTNEKSC